MKTIIISYSFTGNNKTLADAIALVFSAEHIEITESGKRTFGTIGLDMLFNRTPKIHPTMNAVEESDLVLFVGPVWMGHIAAPFRACFKGLKSSLKQYAFISLSGGNDGPNSKLAGELKKRLGKRPAAVIDLHIVDILPPKPKPTREDASSYRLNQEDVERLSERIFPPLREIMTMKKLRSN
jgi:flavodoxin